MFVQQITKLRGHPLNCLHLFFSFFDISLKHINNPL